MTLKNLFLLIVKIILDIFSRVLIFSAWMYTDNNGQFSTLKTVAFYYGVFILMTVFNIVINRHENWLSNTFKIIKF